MSAWDMAGPVGQFFIGLSLLLLFAVTLFAGAMGLWVVFVEDNK